MVSRSWRRAVAAFIDMNFLLGMLTIPTFLSADISRILQPLDIWPAVILSFLYYVLFQSIIGDGQTIGKMLLGIQVIRMDGMTVGIGSAIVRWIFLKGLIFSYGILYFVSQSQPWVPVSWLFLAVSILTALGGLGFLGILLHPLGQGLHDRCAGTVVVEKGYAWSNNVLAFQEPSIWKKASDILQLGGMLWAIWVVYGYYVKPDSMLKKVEELNPLRVELIQRTEMRNVWVYKKNIPGGDSNVANRPRNSIFVSAYLPAAIFDDTKTRYDQAKKAFQVFQSHPEVLRGISTVSFELYSHKGWEARWPQFHEFPVSEWEQNRVHAQQTPVRRMPPTSEELLKKYKVLDDNRAWKDVLYTEKNFAKIEKEIQRLSGFKDEVGGNRLGLFWDQLEPMGIQDENHFKEKDALFDQWINRYPKSEAPWILKGRLYIAHAWMIRGNGYANTVNPDAWRIYKERLLKARAALDRARQLNPRNPEADESQITVSMGLSDDRETMEGYFKHGVQACPYHYGVHSAKMEFIKQKWGGSDEEMFAFARGLYNARDKYPLLSRLIAEAHSEIECRDNEHGKYFGQEKVWSEIQGSYESIFKRYPSYLRMRSKYAVFAKDAKKFQIAYDQFEKIGNRFYWGTWDSLADYNVNRAYVTGAVGWDWIKPKANPDKGFPLLLKAYELNPASAWTTSELADDYRRYGKWDKAVFFAKAALECQLNQDDQSLALAIIEEGQRHLAEKK